MLYEKWLVVGASGGIGLGLVKEIVVSTNDSVIATARDLSIATELQDFAKENRGRVSVVQADFNDEDNSAATVQEIQRYTKSLDHVIINAGIAESPMPLESSSAGDFNHHFATNVAGSHTTIKALYPLVLASDARHRDISFISTAVSRIGNLQPTAERVAKMFDVDYHPLGAYSVSKAALNMLVRSWALRLEDRGIAVALLHPGTVKTDAIDVPGAISVQESAQGLIRVVQGISVKITDSGVLAYNGGIVPW